jgi:2-amino-1-hydroxyethylphosphonate dioxygenase (glycine-forming)
MKLQKILFMFSCLFTTAHLVSEIPLFEEMVTIYNKYGGEKYMIQEEIIQRSHILQAAYLAEAAGAPEDFVVALLLHDIGQVSNQHHVGQTNFLHANHDEIGGDWLLERGFASHICDFVRFHTLAKIVLCIDDPDYYNRLSMASKISYEVQKDKFGSEAIANFISHPYSREYMAVRRCDDMAKIIGFNTPNDGGNISKPDNPLPDFPMYCEVINRVLSGQGSDQRNEDWIIRIETMYNFMAIDREAFEELVRLVDSENIVVSILSERALK